QSFDEAVDNFQSATGSFSFRVPKLSELSADNNTIAVELTSEDTFGNQSAVSVWNYAIETDEKPQISLRTPAAGSKVTEGEQMIINALVSDDRQLSEVIFFTRIDGIEKPIKNYSNISNAKQADYFSATLRVPNQPDSKLVKVGVRAIDNKGQQVELILDIEILDDGQAPEVVLYKPAKDLQLYPGQSFEITGTASDNYYIDNVELKLKDQQGNLTPLTWELFSRKDRIETVNVANQNSFGSIVVSKHFYSDFSGRIRIPVSAVDTLAGNSYQLIAIAEDNGVNEGHFDSVNIEILEDDVNPIVKFKKPGKLLVENQQARIEFSISDNIAVASYRVLLKEKNSQAKLLFEELGASGNQVAVAEQFDISAYQPTESQNIPLQILIEATDSSGNQALYSHALEITKDRAPKVSIINELPEQQAVRGGVYHATLNVEDDYALEGSSSFAVSSSVLNSASGIRGPTGLEIDGKPAIRFDYSEADNEAATVLINGETYLDFSNNQLTTFAKPTEINSLAVQGASPVEITYSLTLYSNDPCSVGVSQLEFTQSTPLQLTELLSADITRVEIQLQSASAELNFIKSIYISFADIKVIDKYKVAGITKVISRVPSIAVSLNGLGLIESSKLFETTNNIAKFGFVNPITHIAGINRYAVYGHSLDRYSKNRGDLPLQKLSELTVIEDSSAPDLTISEPLSGKVLVPLQGINIRALLDENTDMLSTIKVLQNREKQLSELGTVFAQKEFNFPYKVPKELDNGVLELALIAEDRSGHQTLKTLTFPLAKNEKPQLAFTGFHSYKVNGSYLKNITDAQRLNYGEFWVRNGETFTVDTLLTDDAGLSKYEINRLN
ncbi:MAG: hypothetical protein GY951_06765, partial [Psychromonas sp.]|nr:hypothetical protein [Psychromonas sp.]